MTDKNRAPALFVGHGSPMNAIKDNKIRQGWIDMGARLGKPKAIVAISAHWYTKGRFVHTAPHNKQIYDMYGFPAELYAIKYAPVNDSAVAKRACELLGSAACGTDEWGIDHGVWSVLCNMYPDADVPVVMISTDASAEPTEHFKAGRKLAALRDEGAMILGSGNVVHNLGRVNWNMTDGYSWNKNFDETIREAIVSRDFEKVVHFRKLDRWRDALPTPDHFFPLLTVLGAVADDDSIEVFNEIRELGSMSQTSYLFE